MRKFLVTLLLLSFLLLPAFSEEKYYITETQLQSFENTITYQCQTIESQSKELKTLSEKYKASERTNELMNKIIIGETAVILTLIPITTFIIVKYGNIR